MGSYRINFGQNSVSKNASDAPKFEKTKNAEIMDYPNYEGKHNKNVDGYKVPGDGNAPNNQPQPGNDSFEENPHTMTHKSPDDIPGKEFNTGDKAFHDSSKADFTPTVSNFLHAESANDDSETEYRIDMQFKTPDGDR